MNLRRIRANTNFSGGLLIAVAGGQIGIQDDIMPGVPLRDQVLALMRAPACPPMTRSELARKLEVPADRRTELRSALSALVAEGVVQEGKKSRYVLRAKAANRLTGTLKFHPKGHAYLLPDLADPANEAALAGLPPAPRVFVARRDAGTALDGDRVLVSLAKPAARPSRGRSAELLPPVADELRGRVESILSRRSGKVVGVFRSNRRFGWVECEDKAIAGNIEVTHDSTAQPGQLVVVDLASWTDSTAAPHGRVVEVLGWPGDPGSDIVAVIHRFGLRTSFPEPVLTEARSVPEEPDAAEIARRRDWRDKLVITIDPADAKDHDDAVWVEAKCDGWWLAVHIADVSHYIRPGSALDHEAIERGNSTYLVDRVLPMLPVELSNGICSLKPHVDRLTKCALLDVSSDGEITGFSFFDAVIHSQAKLSYEQAQEILDGKPAPKESDKRLVPMVREAWKLASTMRRRRFEQGSLDLEMPEVRIRLDSEGRACAAEHVVHTESHQLIEECMLAANEAVARVLRRRMKPAIHRIHEDPDPSRLLEYAQTAMLFGYRPGDLTNRAHIQKLLDASKGRPEEHLIKLGLLKSLKRAAYSAEPIGHYGLAKSDYCHFTSPIRRYADLIVHRALQPLLENPPPRPDRTPSQAELRTMSRHISDTERVSADAETETRMIKLFEYLGRVADMHDPHEFDGLVTDVRPMGLMVEVPDLGVRGVVRREDLPEGRWRLEAHRMAWVSSAGVVIQSGMRVPLHVTGLDREKRFVDFAVAGPPTAGGIHPSNLPTKRPPVKKVQPKPKGHSKPGPTATKSGKSDAKNQRRRSRSRGGRRN
ncbi:MAG: VacB/RNase II family 3'-5' exoribonuclease [Verrucomicrobia bacterium]|nr:VacB/RNase II family 3'-5' exoribonuclease [Verrucomicrobiota bacterium]